MKKVLLSFLSLILGTGIASAQTRYLDEVFTDVTLTENVHFATNWNFLPSTAPGFEVKTDVYTPTGDTETGRACVIVLHTGNFLPKYINQSPTGDKKDSSIVVTSELFAKRGYVAFAPDYRIGWNATSVDPTFGSDIRRGTFINAIYRALNDVKALVRFIKKDVAEGGNTYGIDPDKIIIYGHGSGGYLSLAYGSLDRIEELENEPTGKWLSTTTTGSFVQNELYVDTALVGGVEGFGGQVNDTNHYGYDNDVMACINVGGALGDSAWMEAGEPPLVSFHCPDDGYAPFTSGLVIVPTTQEVVVDVVGSRWANGQANALGNNDVLYGGNTYNDDYTVAADAALASNHPNLGLNPADYKGLFPFRRPIIQWPFQEAAPWDWWDENQILAEATPYVGAAAAQAIHDNGVSGSPTMSAAQGRAYLDTIHGFLAPRLYQLISPCPTSTSSSTVTECSSYTWNGQTYNQTGVYTFQTTNSGGCDSIATLNLTITPNYEDNESYVLCGGQTVTVGGVIYSQGGQYTQLISGNNGCDTVLTIDISAEQSPSVSILGNTLITANSTETYAIVDPVGYNFNWSVTNGTILSGQGTVSTTIFWDSSGSGEVSVTVSNNNCSYTFSLPVSSIPVGISETFGKSVLVQPNPSNGIFSVVIPANLGGVKVLVHDVLGKEVYNSFHNSDFDLNLGHEDNGVYTLQLIGETGSIATRIIKQ